MFDWLLEKVLLVSGFGLALLMFTLVMMGLSDLLSGIAYQLGTIPFMLILGFIVAGGFQWGLWFQQCAAKRRGETR